MPNLFESIDAAGKAFWNIATLYGFSRKEQCFLLAQPLNRVRMTQMENAKKIPDSEFGFAVAEELSLIHKMLWNLYPHVSKEDPQFKYKTTWFHRKNEMLDNVSPIAYAMATNRQVAGLQHIRSQLELHVQSQNQPQADA